MTEMARTYGDLVHLHLGERHDYLLDNADYIKQVLSAGEAVLSQIAVSVGLRTICAAGPVGKISRTSGRALISFHPLFRKASL
jgi:hypothetical protein